VPAALDAADAETFVVNGITAYQMLHRIARVKTGGRILVHGASGGVGTTLVQLAHAAGIEVIGTASARNLDVVTALGATAVDYRGDVPARVRELAPGGVDAVFDHVGGPGIVDSFRLLAPGGTLVAYGSASTKDDPGNSRLPVLKLFARLLWWNALPNRRRAHFYNVWGGKRNLARFRARLAEDLTAVFDLAAKGQLKAQVAARIPLTEAAKALTLAESGTVTGKVVLVP
jgi:NADPH:quinone reductase-like Zn-dependent oxidoreductase